MSFRFGLVRFLFIFSFFLFCVQFDWILFVLSVVFVVFFRLLVRLSVSSLLSVRGFLCVMTTYPSYCTYFPVYLFTPSPITGGGMPGAARERRACSRGGLYGQDLPAFRHGTPGSPLEEGPRQGVDQGG